MSYEELMELGLLSLEKKKGKAVSEFKNATCRKQDLLAQNTKRLCML